MPTSSPSEDSCFLVVGLLICSAAAASSSSAWRVLSRVARRRAGISRLGQVFADDPDLTWALQFPLATPVCICPIYPDRGVAGVRSLRSREGMATDRCGDERQRGLVGWRRWVHDQ